MLTPTEEALLIRLLSEHDTPTEAVRRALGADKCKLRLTFGKMIVTVCDISDAAQIRDGRVQ